MGGVRGPGRAEASAFPLDGPVNAVVVRGLDRAREQARQVEQAVARGADLPLAGVPMMVKATFNIAVLPTCFGIVAAKDYRPTEDAAAVRRLKRAGKACPASTLERYATGVSTNLQDGS